MKVLGERRPLSPSSTVQTKAVNYGRLVGTVPAFVLSDICYMSPAASWRLRLTACGNNASPTPTHISSLLRSFLTQAVPQPQWRSHRDETPCTKPCGGRV